MRSFLRNLYQEFGRDIGENFGTGAYLNELRRTKWGNIR